MKILFYNLGYGRGHDGSVRSYILKAHRFLHSSRMQQHVVLDEVIHLVKKEKPDVVAYAEISTGSFRNAQFNQHRYLVKTFGERSVADAAVSKYGETMLNVAPFHAGNCNGVISFLPAHITEHYLARSRKKLVFRVELEDVTIFVVHLPLVSTDRRKQLHEIAMMVNQTSGNVVVCGDFNIFDGLDELAVLQEETDLQVAGNGELTYPSAHPRLQLDVFLYRGVDRVNEPRLKVMNLQVSDHLPVLFEWNE